MLHNRIKALRVVAALTVLVQAFCSAGFGTMCSREVSLEIPPEPALSSISRSSKFLIGFMTVISSVTAYDAFLAANKVRPA